MKITNFFYHLHAPLNERIIVLADIHYYSKRNMRKLKKVLRIVTDNHPNYICIPGDLIDQRYIKDEQFLLDWLSNLAKCAPTVISLGNHELIYSKTDYYSHDQELFQKISKIKNVYFLNDEDIKIGDINFIGLTLPGGYYYDLKEDDEQYLINYINKHVTFTKKGYNVLLCHSPIEILKSSVFNNLNISEHIDLVLCGHMHGGITPNFIKSTLKGKGFVSPHRKIWVNYSYGRYAHNKTDFIISSGITKSSHKNKLSFLDFLFSPEVTIIDLNKQKRNKSKYFRK